MAVAPLRTFRLPPSAVGICFPCPKNVAAVGQAGSRTQANGGLYPIVHPFRKVMDLCRPGCGDGHSHCVRSINYKLELLCARCLVSHTDETVSPHIVRSQNVLRQLISKNCRKIGFGLPRFRRYVRMTRVCAINLWAEPLVRSNGFSTTNELSN